jgi:MFS family permease
VRHPGNRLPPVVKRLGAVSFLNDLASEMVYPLLPALITTRLGAGALALGLLDGVSEAIAAAVKLGAGRLADRVHLRRPLVVGGYAVAAIARPLMAYSSAAWQVIALRATDRVGKGVRNPPRDTIIADAASPTIRGRAFGYHRSLDHAGAVVGPLLAWLMLAAGGMTPFQVIAWSAVPGVLAVCVVAWATRNIRRATEPRAERGRRSDVSRPVAASRVSSPAVLVAIAAFAFARFPETLFLLRLQEAGLAVALVPALWALLHVIRAGGSYPGGWLSDRVGARHTMVLGWGAYALVCLGLALADSALVASLWFLGFGIVAILTESPERAVVSEAGASRRGTSFGTYHASVGLAALFGGLAFGTIYAQMGGAIALTISAGLAGLLATIGTFPLR